MHCYAAEACACDGTNCGNLLSALRKWHQAGCSTAERLGQFFRSLAIAIHCALCFFSLIFRCSHAWISHPWYPQVTHQHCDFSPLTSGSGINCASLTCCHHQQSCSCHHQMIIHNWIGDDRNQKRPMPKEPEATPLCAVSPASNCCHALLSNASVLTSPLPWRSQLINGDDVTCLWQCCSKALYSSRADPNAWIEESFMHLLEPCWCHGEQRKSLMTQIWELWDESWSGSRSKGVGVRCQQGCSSVWWGQQGGMVSGNGHHSSINECSIGNCYTGFTNSPSANLPCRNARNKFEASASGRPYFQNPSIQETLPAAELLFMHQSSFSSSLCCAAEVGLWS